MLRRSYLVLLVLASSSNRTIGDIATTCRQAQPPRNDYLSVTPVIVAIKDSEPSFK